MGRVVDQVGEVPRVPLGIVLPHIVRPSGGLNEILGLTVGLVVYVLYDGFELREKGWVLLLKFELSYLGHDHMS